MADARQTAEQKPKRAQSAAQLANLKGGSRKGVPNKTTAALKDMILGALDRQGGIDYLVRQADENPAAFMTLLGKVLPTTLAGDPNAPLQVQGFEVRLVKPGEQSTQ